MVLMQRRKLERGNKMKICYREINFRRDSLALIQQVNGIIQEYLAKGYSLSLRQVYYQLVARNVIENKERSYKNLGNLISDGRLAGLIDWDAIEDRTRNIRGNSHWNSPSHIIQSAAYSFAYDKWEDQDYHVEVWVEKDALVGVVGQICEKLDVSYFSCRGYVSQSEMWSAAQRIIQKSGDGQKMPVILHLGDHDPSGKDMSRDIEERLEIFGVTPIFRRIALNMDQIEEYLPPPNPTKVTDTRAGAYIDEFGYECWELDALRPEVMEQLIRNHVTEFCDETRYKQALDNERQAKEMLETVAENWTDIEADYAN
ncbi:hypothetical protein [Paenibacillus sp. HB172176]|uniref:hypothetical protein n=1 Tax=Paenibacillus sp. HB172176 TaxID=2493690 RepID=UPI001F1001A4|nr:hypothetical protein [Paenibacillus sp. HB172176]